MEYFKKFLVSVKNFIKTGIDLWYQLVDLVKMLFNFMKPSDSVIKYFKITESSQLVCAKKDEFIAGIEDSFIKMKKYKDHLKRSATYSHTISLFVDRNNVNQVYDLVEQFQSESIQLDINVDCIEITLSTRDLRHQKKQIKGIFRIIEKIIKKFPETKLQSYKSTYELYNSEGFVRWAVTQTKEFKTPVIFVDESMYLIFDMERFEPVKFIK